MSLPYRALGEVLRNGYKCAAGAQIPAGRSISGCSNPCPSQKYMDVKCKTALITGGCRGIGLAIADGLLNCGLRKVVISDMNCEKGMEALEYLTSRHGAGTAEYYTLDVTNHKQFEDVFKEVIHNEGSVDILVNNAGICRDKTWEKQIDVNLKGVFRGVLLANKYMPKQGNKGGCVVNLSSVIGFDSNPYVPGYSCTKHAVLGLTRSFGSKDRYKRNGVRLVALCPGLTATDIVAGTANNQLRDEWGRKFARFLQGEPNQKPCAVGKGTVYMVEYGPPGSVWVVEGSTLQRVKPPRRISYQQKVLDL